MDVDVEGMRLFVAGLENGSLEVIDLQAGKWTHSIPGFKKPQGILYVPELNKLFVASGDDGMVRVFRGDTLDLLDSIQLEAGPNRVVFEPHSKLVYVGYGGKDAGKDFGEVGVIDARNDKAVDSIKVAAHPSELLLGKSGSTLFVFISIANQLQVIDTNKRQVVSSWQVSSQHPGDAAFDESTSRLFIGTRTPAEMTYIRFWGTRLAGWFCIRVSTGGCRPLQDYWQDSHTRWCGHLFLVSRSGSLLRRSSRQ